MKIAPESEGFSQQLAGGTGGTGTPASGDLGGTLPAPIVDGIGGVPIANAPTSDGQILVYNITLNQFEWQDPASTAPTGPAGGDLSGTYPDPSVVDDSHSHTGATLPVSAAVGHLLIADTHSMPLIFDDLIQNDDSTGFMYADA